MSCLKIPDLNLFRGKRQATTNQIDRISQVGLKLIKKGNKKQVLDEIQAELYLDNYKKNLQHFVSPTKYKQQAEKYLKQNKFTDEIYLKALMFPKSQRFCPNCYDRCLKAKNLCYCQQLPKIASANRYHNNPNLARMDREVKNVTKEVKKQMEDNISNHQQKKMSLRQNEIISQEFILTESEVAQNQSINFPNPSTKQKSNSIVHSFSNRIVPDNSAFLKDMRMRENYLQNIHMNIGQSRALEIDFLGLNQAKRQYVHKSHEILAKLNELIKTHDRI